MYYRARYYDTAVGEFISPDPLEYVDGMSQYRAYFVPGATDPLGLCPKPTTVCCKGEFRPTRFHDVRKHKWKVTCRAGLDAEDCCRDYFRRNQGYFKFVGIEEGPCEGSTDVPLGRCFDANGNPIDHTKQRQECYDAVLENAGELWLKNQELYDETLLAISREQATLYKRCESLCNKNTDTMCRERIWACKRAVDSSTTLNQSAALVVYLAGKATIAASLESGYKECRRLFPCAGN
jgi:hypothetical protein